MDRKVGWNYGRALLIGLFVSVGCGPTDEEVEADFYEEQSELWCEMTMVCQSDVAMQGCITFEPDECEGFNAEKADACIEAMEEALATYLDDEDTCSQFQMPQVCFEATPAITDAPGCEGVPGRPILEGGEMVLADVYGGGPLASSADSHAAAHWLEAARMEHASVAAFGRLSTELLALGAPLALVRGAHEAAIDEARHTDLCLKQARALGHASWSLGALRVVPARPEISLETLALEALIEGCVGEGIAAAQAAVSAGRADAPVAQCLRQIARDELQHAKLAWQVLGWALSQDPSLATPLREALAECTEQAASATPSARPAVHRHGVLSSEEAHRLARTFVQDVTRPALELVLREHRRRAA